MKKTNLQNIKYPLVLSEKELSILGSTLHYCLLEDVDFMCCQNCVNIGIELLEKISVLFQKKHKHS